MASWDVKGLRIAREISTWSKDPSSKVGCYIATPNHTPISFGFNGFPRGIADDERLNIREQKYQIILHAEVNAILNATANLEGATVYSYPFTPCSQCASMLIQKGIARLVAPDIEIPERWLANFKMGQDLLAEAGVAMVLVSPAALE